MANVSASWPTCGTVAFYLPVSLVGQAFADPTNSLTSRYSCTLSAIASVRMGLL